jgi:hypothetical protein
MIEGEPMPPPGYIEVEGYDEKKRKYRERYFLNDLVGSNESQSGGSDFNFCCQARTDLPRAIALLRVLVERVRELEAKLESYT